MSRRWRNADDFPGRSTLFVALVLGSCNTQEATLAGAASAGGTGGTTGAVVSNRGGAGGSTFAAGGNSSAFPGAAGTTGAAGTPGITPLSCANLPLCDGFETGDALDPAKWTVAQPNCSGTGTLALDNQVAHGGQRSVRTDGKGGYCNHVFFSTKTALASPDADALYGRFFIRFSTPLTDSHVSFATFPNGLDGGKTFRLGGQNKVLIWNREKDDATLPELSPTGTALSLAPTVKEWHCVEFALHRPSGNVETWVNGAAVAGLQADGTPTTDIDGQWSRGQSAVDLTAALFGWESYGGDAQTLWFDDVALGNARIGCDQ